MGEILLPALAVGAGTFVILMVIFFVARMFSKKKMGAFKDYLAQKFPDLKDAEIFAAKQKSKGIKLDIALALNEAKKEIVLLLDNKGEDLTHKVYGFKDLKAVDSTDQIIARGALPKTYSYEQTMKLTFKDGGTYLFVSENVSNKRGDDKGAQLVKDTFAPWEGKLKEIMK